jgi:uncharacterized protein with HEPN domain
MSGGESRLQDYLEHIRQAMRRIEGYVENVTQDAFLQNQLLQDAVIRNLEIIGEASRNIARHNPEFTSAHPELPLQSAYEMRNVLAHAYFEVDLEIVWRTIEIDLPYLARQIDGVLKEFGETT